MTAVQSDMEWFGSVKLPQVLSDALPAQFDAIDAEKNDGIILDDIVKFGYGVGLVEGQYPALFVLGLREHTDSESDYHRMVWRHYSIEVYSTGDDAEKLEKISARMARAIVQVLTATYREDGRIVSVEYPPVMSRGSGLYKGAAVLFDILVPVAIDSL